MGENTTIKNNKFSIGFYAAFCRKIFFAAAVVFCPLFFSSCFFESINDDSSSKEIYFSVSGKAVLDGNVPLLLKNKSFSESENSRTALPSFSSNVKYYISAKSSDSTYEVTSADFDFGSDFSIELPGGTWTLTATAFYSGDSEKKAIMLGNKEIVITESGLTGQVIELLPLTDGTGNVGLKIGFDSDSTGIARMTANWTIAGVAYSKTVTDGTDFEFNLIPDTNAYTKVPAGAHSVSFMFYDTSYNIKYWFSQTINVFPEMTTDTWIKGNSDYIDEENNRVYITPEMVEKFVETSYYVSSDGNDSTGTGSYFAPFATIQKAVDKVVAANKINQTIYAIYLLSPITGDDANYASDSTDGNSLVSIKKDTNNLSVLIEPLGTDVFDINAARNSSSTSKYRILYAKDVTLTLRNLNFYGGYSEKNGGAICISGGSVLFENCTVGKTTAETDAFTDGIQNTTYAPGADSNSNYSKESGGGIYADLEAEVLIKNSKIVNNFAAGDGGGIALSGSTLNLDSGSEIFANGSGTTSGTAVCAKKRSTIDFRNGSIHHNYSNVNMGVPGIYIADSVLNMNPDAKIRDNYSGTYCLGAGVYIGTGAVANFLGGTAENNSYIAPDSHIFNCDVGYYAGITDAVLKIGGAYIENIYSQKAPLEITTSLSGLSEAKKIKLYTDITAGKKVLQTSDSSVSLSSYINCFELYDYFSGKKASDYRLKVDSSTGSQSAVISEIQYETLYLDSVKGSDSNAGSSYDLPLKTLERAVALLDTNVLAPTIYIMNGISVNADEIASSYWNFALSDSSPKVSFKRYDGSAGGTAFANSLLTIDNGGIVNAAGIIFDGNKDKITTSDPLIYVSDGGTLTLNTCLFNNGRNSADPANYDVYLKSLNSKLALQGTLYTTYIYVEDYSSALITLDTNLKLGTDANPSVKIHSYKDGVSLFASSDSGKISESVRKYFTVTDESGKNYSINADGTLTEKISAISLSSVSSYENLTEGSVYSVSTEDELKLLASLCNGGSSYTPFEKMSVILENDIELTCSQDNPFTPIGTSVYTFAGTFDGQDHKIKNLYINSTGQVGLFAALNGGTVKNLTVEGTVYGSSSEVLSNYGIGGIVGHASDTAVIENCVSNVNVSTASITHAGGICGYATKSAVIRNCINLGNVTSSVDYAGGIVGMTKDNSNAIYNCANFGVINGTDYVAGIAGSAAGDVAICYDVGNVSSSTSGVNVAAIANVSGTGNGYYRNCFYLSSAATSAFVGTSVTAQADKDGESLRSELTNAITNSSSYSDYCNSWDKTYSYNSKDYPVCVKVNIANN